MVPWSNIAGDIVSVSLKSMGLISIASCYPGNYFLTCEKDFRWEMFFVFVFLIFLKLHFSQAAKILYVEVIT